MNSPVTMRDILKALTLELGEAEGQRVFEWYCATYRVTVGDVAPDTVVYEVLGLTAEEVGAGVAVKHVEGDTYRATDLDTGIYITFPAGAFNDKQTPGIPAAYTEKLIKGEVTAGEAAKATAAAMYRIGAFLALHRPELVSPEI